MSELDRAWAATQVEAMADGSLPPAAEQRMLTVLAREPALQRQVEDAKALRRALAGLARSGAPAGLWRRLWRIPAVQRQRRMDLVPAAVMATAALVAVVLGLQDRTDPTVEELAQRTAMQDFALVMGYLQKGVIVAATETNQNVGAGMMDAYVMSRSAMGTAQDAADKGVQESDD